MKDQDNAITWFEIPVSDFDRARSFYQKILEVTIQEIETPNEVRMGLFPAGEHGVGGSICHHPEFYRPGQEGPVIYLNGNPDLQKILDRVKEEGGEIVVPKTAISPEHGFMAVFLDTEGNRIALQSRG